MDGEETVGEAAHLAAKHQAAADAIRKEWQIGFSAWYAPTFVMNAKRRHEGMAIVYGKMAQDAAGS